MARRGRDGRGRRGGGGADRGHVRARGRVGTRGVRVQRHRAGQRAGGRSHVATAPVVRTDLTNTVQVSGALGFAGSYTVANQMQGTAYTALPPPGQVVRRGHRLYEVDGSPVILLYGPRPEWRDLFLGVTPGPDVAQLDANLIALGYATPATLTVSDTFTAATSFAVQRWQAALGLTVTGVVAAGQVAYAPGPLRVASLTSRWAPRRSPGRPCWPRRRPGPWSARPSRSARSTWSAGATGSPSPCRTAPAPSPASSPRSPGWPAPDRPALAGQLRVGRRPAEPSPGGPAGSGPGRQRRHGPAHHPARAPPGRGRAGPGAGHGEHRQRPGQRRARGPGQRPGRAGRRRLRRAGDQGGAPHLTGVHTGLFSSSLVQVSGPGLRAGLKVEVPAP